MLFAYLGPETLLPMTSVLAAAVGVVAMFGRNTLIISAKVLRAIVRLPRLLSRTESSSLPYQARQDPRQGRWRGPRTTTAADAVSDVDARGVSASQSSR